MFSFLGSLLTATALGRASHDVITKWTVAEESLTDRHRERAIGSPVSRHINTRPRNFRLALKNSQERQGNKEADYIIVCLTLSMSDSPDFRKKSRAHGSVLVHSPHLEKTSRYCIWSHVLLTRCIVCATLFWSWLHMLQSFKHQQMVFGSHCSGARRVWLTDKSSANKESWTFRALVSFQQKYNACSIPHSQAIIQPSRASQL